LGTIKESNFFNPVMWRIPVLDKPPSGPSTAGLVDETTTFNAIRLRLARARDRLEEEIDDPGSPCPEQILLSSPVLDLLGHCLLLIDNPLSNATLRDISETICEQIGILVSPKFTFDISPFSDPAFGQASEIPHDCPVCRHRVNNAELEAHLAVCFPLANLPTTLHESDMAHQADLFQGIASLKAPLDPATRPDCEWARPTTDQAFPIELLFLQIAGLANAICAATIANDTLPICRRQLRAFRAQFPRLNYRNVVHYGVVWAFAMGRLQTWMTHKSRLIADWRRFARIARASSAEAPDAGDFLKSFEFVEKIARDGAKPDSVYVVRKQEPDSDAPSFAVRIVPFRGPDDPALRVVVREKQVLDWLSRNYPQGGLFPVVHFAFAVPYARALCLGTECLEGNLVSVLRRVGDDYSFRRKLAAEVTVRIADLHAHGVLVMQLKPTGILWSDALRMLQFTNMAWALALGAEAVLGDPEPWPAEESVYAAPELATGGWVANPAAVDVWSLGVILYEVLSGATVPEALEQLKADPALQALLNGDAPLPQKFGNVLRLKPTALVNSANPEVAAGQELCVRIMLDRPPIAAILAEPFIAQFAQVGLSDLDFVRGPAERPARPVEHLLVDPRELSDNQALAALSSKFSGRGVYFLKSVRDPLLAPKVDGDGVPDPRADTDAAGHGTGM
jgi:hypothetical protein